MKILVVVPHADDEAICMGGTIARLSKINRVNLVVIGFGYGDSMTRQHELYNSRGVLGIGSVTVLPFNESFLDTTPQNDIIGKLDEILGVTDYDQVYYPCLGHHHQDHRAVHEACQAALRNTRCSLLAMYEYPYPMEFSQYFGKMYVDIGETIEVKIKAVECYRSQNISSDDLRRLANARGLEAGCKYAEMFYISRELR